MLRPVVRVALILATAIAGWLAAYLALPHSGLSAARQAAARVALGAAPGYALIALGCYAAASVGAAFWSFRDCSAEAEALQAVRAAAQCGDARTRAVARARAQSGRGLSRILAP